MKEDIFTLLFRYSNLGIVSNAISQLRLVVIIRSCRRSYVICISQVMLTISSLFQNQCNYLPLPFMLASTIYVQLHYLYCFTYYICSLVLPLMQLSQSITHYKMYLAELIKAFYLLLTSSLLLYYITWLIAVSFQH